MIRYIGKPHEIKKRMMDTGLLTFAELAEASEITTVTIRKSFHGKVVKAYTAEAIAKALHCEVSDIFDEAPKQLTTKDKVRQVIDDMQKELEWYIGTQDDDYGDGTTDTLRKYIERLENIL